jgi:transcriptional regulator with XRE-family HTH domain
MNTGTTLREARDRAGLTQIQLAGRTGTSQATISAYESGRKQPAVETFDRLLAATGTRLVVEVNRPPVVVPSARQRDRNARTLHDVLALAEALPADHDEELRYPRLPATMARAA